MSIRAKLRNGLVGPGCARSCDRETILMRRPPWMVDWIEARNAAKDVVGELGQSRPQIRLFRKWEIRGRVITGSEAIARDFSGSPGAPVLVGDERQAGRLAIKSHLRHPCLLHA